MNTRPNTTKTLIEKAKLEVPKFKEHIERFEYQMTIKSHSESTVFSYSRATAQMSLYFKKSPLDLEADEINSYLFSLSQDKDLSGTYFKHAVYGLRFFYRVYHPFTDLKQQSACFKYKDYRQAGKEKTTTLRGRIP